tara:strand:- start:998 stop:1261 length:264 start_codon:yes stop_codon:yes gene_type:complete
MGGLLGGAPKMPGPDPSIAAAQAKQEARLEKQEKRAEAQENSKQRQVAAANRARRTGGLRLLLNEDRNNAQAGIDDSLQTTLGSAQG